MGNKHDHFWLKMGAVGLIALAGSEGILLWSLSRHVPLLPTMARTGVSEPKVKDAEKLTLAQYVEGLVRLDGEPDLLVDRAQAARLVPVIPLFRQALQDGASQDEGASVRHFGTMLIQYIRDTLNEAQLNHLQSLVKRGELGSTSASAIERLPLLDEKLRQRVGMDVDSRNSLQNPVRRSLDKMRIRDLVLGMLLLEQDPEARITNDQAALMLPMRKLFNEVFERAPGEIGQSSIPVVESQVRSILTDFQQERLLDVAQASGIHNIDVNEEELLWQFFTLLAARETGGVFKFRLTSLLAPANTSREGPAVVPGQADLELLVAVRGIVMFLEPNADLRLDNAQVEELKLIAPGIEKCLVNLLNRVKDLSLQEFQGRVLRILRPEQIKYIQAHRGDAIPATDYKPGEEPTAKELKRFLDARDAGVPYRPLIKVGALPPGAQAGDGSYTPPNSSVEAQPEQNFDKGAESDVMTSSNPSVGITASPTAANPRKPMVSMVVYPSPGQKPEPRQTTEPTVSWTLQPSPGKKPALKAEPTVQIPAKTPGIRPSPTVPASPTYQQILEQMPGKRPAPKANLKLPLEALVRGIVITLESQPNLALKPAQTQKLADNLKAYKAALNALESNPSTRSEDIVELTKQLYDLLSQSQRKQIELYEKQARVGLQPGSGESALARELERFTQAKLKGQQYQPLLNKVGNT